MRIVFWVLLLCSSVASAHLLPKQNATINIVDTTAYVVVAVPVTALSGVDDDSSGTLSLQEIQIHTADIERQFNARLRVGAQGMVGTAALTMILPPHTDGNVADSDYVIVMHRVDFPAVPAKPTLETDLFGTRPGEAQMTITVTSGGHSEVAILQASAPGFAFFRGRWQAYVHYLQIGIAHILSGLDHLLFLLTSVIGAASWRYWIAVVTSFTLAHSITLTLSALSILRLPASVVEPGIAASIVLMAGFNLYNYRHRSAPSEKLAMSKVALVFACGLLHGFGFASALGAIATDTGNRLAILAGFNTGIELGQFLFLAVILLLTGLVSSISARHFRPESIRDRPSKVV